MAEVTGQSIDVTGDQSADSSTDSPAQTGTGDGSGDTTAGTPSQHRVGLRSAVTRQKSVGLFDIQHLVRGRHDVDGAGIDLARLVLAPIPHEDVDLAERGPHIAAVHPVDHVDMFPGASGIRLEAAHISAPS